MKQYEVCYVNEIGEWLTTSEYANTREEAIKKFKYRLTVQKILYCRVVKGLWENLSDVIPDIMGVQK